MRAATAESYFRSEVPPGRSGDWCVRRFELTGEPVPGAAPPSPLCYEPAGRYTVLERGDRIFMTDLYNEWWTQRSAIDEACRRGGRVLVTGLGLGLVAEGMLRTPGSRVERVTVVEASGDVIRLVGPHLEDRLGGGLEIVHADAFDWRPPDGTRYAVGWHDIWPNPQAPEALAQAERLEARYARWCDWQGSWPREFLAALAAADGAAARPAR